MKKKVVLFGASGIAQIILDHYRNGIFSDEFDFQYFYVDKEYKKYDSLSGIPIITNLDLIEDIQDYYFFACSMDLRNRKRFIRLAESKNMKPLSIVTPTSFIGENVKIGKGCLIGDKSTIEGQVEIGDYFVLGAYARIGHHSKIGNYCQVSHLSTIGGFNKLHDNVLVNTHCCTAEDIEIEKGSLLGMGAVVFKNVPKGSIMIGNPARSIRSKKAINDD